MKVKVNDIEIEVDGDVESVTVDGKKVKVKVKQPVTYSPYTWWPNVIYPNYYPTPEVKPPEITWTVTSSTTNNNYDWSAANEVFEDHNL